MKRRGSGTLTVGDVGERVRLQAWVRRRRDHGGVVFLDLRDRSGTVQVVVRPDEHAEVAEALMPARLEWVVEVEGVVQRRSPETVNTRIPTGEIEVVADAGRVLSRCDPLPFNLEGPVEASEETRLRYRFLDLRRPELAANLALRHRVVLEALRYFDEEGFVHVETPIQTRSTPEGARDYLVPSRVHRGSFFALPQSPQLFKQILMVAGLERYVQICRCFRDEDLRADRQPEFSQIDVEMSFVDRDDVMATTEGLVTRLFPLAGWHPEPPFPRLTYREVMDRYGIDRPDLRSPLEIVDLTETLGGSEFRAFRATVEEGGAIRAMRVPGAAAASRKQLDGWAETARAQGVAGVLALRHRDGELQFQVKDVLSPGELTAAADVL
ncbi:MAG: aspartate--tRNA ligase, partial [Thermoanaerobaculia bacterium]|nr:aspartate--tRNA ligase [Thermoanaerobaculia bacterium]